jgi:hypothetical protein
MKRPQTPVGLALVLVIAVSAACSGSDDDGQALTGATSDTTTESSSATSPATGATSTTPTPPQTTATSQTVETTAPTPSSTVPPRTTTPPTTGCTDGQPDIPDGAGTGEVIDLDDDGRRDTAWLAGDPGGSRQLGVRTAGGGGDVAEISSASPVGLVVLVVDADEKPPVELLVSDNRTVQLWAFADCQLQPVIGPDGAPYLFDLGFRGTGTGVGCVGTGQERDLVGLNITEDDGTDIKWSRTVVELDGLQATHGETVTGSFQQPDDAGAIELLHTVTCGELSIDQDGIRQPEI